MPKIRKHARAESDLIEIWLYTYERWGETQAEQPTEERGACDSSTRRVSFRVRPGLDSTHDLGPGVCARWWIAGKLLDAISAAEQVDDDTDTWAIPPKAERSGVRLF